MADDVRTRSRAVSSEGDEPNPNRKVGACRTQDKSFKNDTTRHEGQKSEEFKKDEKHWRRLEDSEEATGMGRAILKPGAQLQPNPQTLPT